MSDESAPPPVDCFDAHSDLLFSVIQERDLGAERVIESSFLPGMEAGRIRARVAAIYLDDQYLPEMALRRALHVVDAFHAEIDATNELRLARTAAELREGWHGSGHTLLLGLEGVEPLGGDLSLLDVFFRLGLRVATITHSRRNQAADGSPFTPTDAGTPGGLSRFGVELVERMNELGIVVDVSHLNEPGFWDVLERSNDPVMASHSNAKALLDHPRNLSDEQLRALAEHGGVVGLNAVGAFLAVEDPTLDDFLDHLDHAVAVAGLEHVGMGFDFTGYLRDYLSPSEIDRLPSLEPPKELRADTDVRSLAGAITDRGYAEDEVRRLMGGNLLRLFAEVLP